MPSTFATNNAIKRQRAQAELLRKMQDEDKAAAEGTGSGSIGTMVGGHFIPSYSDAISKATNSIASGIGAYYASQADEKANALEDAALKQQEADNAMFYEGLNKDPNDKVNLVRGLQNESTRAIAQKLYEQQMTPEDWAPGTNTTTGQAMSNKGNTKVLPGFAEAYANKIAMENQGKTALESYKQEGRQALAGTTAAMREDINARQFNRTQQGKLDAMKQGQEYRMDTLAATNEANANKLNQAQIKQALGVKNVQVAADEYKSELSKWSNTDALSPDARANMGTKYNNMLLQAKEAYNLGVLNGPDYEILTTVMTDPLSAKGLITSKDAMLKQVDEFNRLMGRVGQTVVSNPREPNTPPAPPPGNRIVPISEPDADGYVMFSDGKQRRRKQ